jgi:hypothetical protein
MEKILGFGDTNVCLFCGHYIKGQWDDNDDRIYECDCPDAQQDKKISKQIEKLEQQRPQPKYEISQEYVLRDIIK